MNTTEQDIGALKADMANVKGDVADMRGDIKDILATLNRAQGYWKMLLLISGFSATIGGLVATWFPWLIKH